MSEYKVGQVVSSSRLILTQVDGELIGHSIPAGDTDDLHQPEIDCPACEPTVDREPDGTLVRHQPVAPAMAAMTKAVDKFLEAQQ